MDREVGVVRGGGEREKEDRAGEQERTSENRVDAKPSERPRGRHCWSALLIHRALVNDMALTGSTPVYQATS